MPPEAPDSRISLFPLLVAVDLVATLPLGTSMCLQSDFGSRILCHLMLSSIRSSSSGRYSSQEVALILLHVALRRLLESRPSVIGVNTSWSRDKPSSPRSSASTGSTALKELLRCEPYSFPCRPWRSGAFDSGVHEVACTSTMTCICICTICVKLPLGSGSAAWASMEI